MLDLLVQWVFKIVNKLISTIMSPLISGITRLFPSTASIVTNIGSFFGYTLTYVNTACRLLLIPNSLLVLLFTYFEVKYSIHLLIIVAKGTIKLYNYLKP